MNVLVIGGGGREHALAWKAAQSDAVQTVFVAPGNAGTATEAGIENVAIAADDIDGLLAFAQEKQIGLTIVGPEAPLVLGVVDKFTAAGLSILARLKLQHNLKGQKRLAKTFLHVTIFRPPLMAPLPILRPQKNMYASKAHPL